MHRLLVALTVLLSTLILACSLCAKDFKFETNQLKERQKAEVKALKLKHKFTKDMIKSQSMSKAMRKQIKNEMKREEKTLRQKHDHELEELNDRLRVLKESQGN